MSSETYLALLLDSPMQSWGHTSRFERRTTALHPTRSAVLGLIAAALGINKHAPDEASRLAKFASLKITTVSLPRRDRYGRELLIQRLEDYHTVTGIRPLAERSTMTRPCRRIVIIFSTPGLAS